jgi:4'-phosphopantetheinyl transferase
MLTPGHIQVWRVRLDEVTVPQPTQGELARAARLRSDEVATRYLKSHGAMRDILSRATTAPLEFALREHGKPYLPLSPELRFNLSHSHEMALIAVALDREVGVDIERFRSLPEFSRIADRFFPPSEPRPTDEIDFFRHWTRIEAVLKASGVGLYGTSRDPEGEWTIEGVPVPDGFAGAVAAEGTGFTISVHDYGDDR